MLPLVRMLFRTLTLIALLAANAPAQSVDVTGWGDLRWGITKPAAWKTLQAFGAHECNRTNSVACADAPGADVLVVEKYNVNKIPFTVVLFFALKNGLSKVIMTAEDKRDAFDKMLLELTLRYGRPGLQSEYDGDEELVHTTWTWLKAHGKLSLESEETSGIFTLTYEARR